MHQNIEKKIKQILDKIRPFLNGDGGDVEFIKFENGICYIKMLGACMNCHGLDNTIKYGIEALLCEEVPEVIGVENVEQNEE